jgi:hypothetical protein
MKKDAQISVTFNWVYILIAGAIILLFFVGLIFKQKASSEQQLSIEIVDILESIFTGAQVSEKTKTPIDTSGLADYTLFFDCEEKVTSYGLVDTPSRSQERVASIFSPQTIQSPRLILWSLPYSLPYKVTDFLFITPTNQKYYLISSPANAFAQEFITTAQERDTKTDQLIVQNSVNVEQISVQEYLQLSPEPSLQIRIVDLQSDIVTQGAQIPPQLIDLSDSQVSAVRFVANQIYFYQKKGSVWKASGPAQGIPLISLGGKRDAAKFAAIFSGSAQIYSCNMNKAFERLYYVTEVYKEKANKMEEFYADDVSACSQYSATIKSNIEIFYNSAALCAQEIELDCSENLADLAKDIQTQNNLLKSCPLKLY